MKKRFLILLSVFQMAIVFKAISQNASINTSGAAADASAMLDITATDKGLLIPRMTSAQRTAIASPADALLVYQTDATRGFYYYSTNSSSWVLLVGTGSAINSLNGLTAASQTFAIGTAGTDFNISSSGSVHTFNIPDASGAARGLITTGVQTVAGSKTFSSAPLFSSLTAGSVPYIGTGGLLSQNNANFFWDATNSRLGVGTNTPTQKLDVNGTIVASGTTYPNYAYNSANRMAFGESNVPSNETGSVVQYGSGSSSRNMLFAFTKTSVNTSFFGNDGTQMMLGSESTAPITFRTGLVYSSANIIASGSEAMRITSGGNLGIGTTSPSTKLHVQGANPLTLLGVAAGTNTTADSLLTITSGLVRKLPLSTFASSGNDWSTTGNAGTNSGSYFLGTTDNKSLSFRTNNFSRMHLDSLGGLFIGDSATAYTSNVNNTQAGLRSDWTTSLLSGDTPRIASQGQIRLNLISTSGSATVRALNGAAFTGVSNGVTSTADLNAGYFTAHRRTIGSVADGTGTLNTLSGIGIDYGHTGGANAGAVTTNVYGARLTPYYGTGTITNLFGLAITAPVTGGNVTNMYDIFLASHALTGVTNAWGIYQQNTKNNYFAGNIGIGTTTPSTKLHVQGANPLTLLGVAAGTSTTADSLLTITSGLVRKVPMSTFGAAGSDWSTTGNTGTNWAANFLGTADNTSLRLRTNNIQSVLLDSLGNVAIGNNPLQTAGVNIEKLLVDAGSTAANPTSTINVITGRGYINSYLQLNIQNKNAGTAASSDVVSTADNGDETTNYVDMGINSSGNTSNYFGAANDAYLYNLGQNLLIGTGTAGKVLAFLTGGGTQSTNERMRIDGTGKVGIANIAPTEKLDVTGNVRFSGALMPNNSPGAAGTVLVSSGANNPPLWTAIGASAPIYFAGGIFSITQANTSTNGYLSSTDWNTFNNKASTTNSWSTTGNASAALATNFLGTTDATSSLRFRTNNTQRVLFDSAGNVAIGNGPLQTAGVNIEKLLVDAGSTAANPTPSYNLINGRGYINSYLQLNIQNKSPDVAASSDVVATADNGDESTGFIDMGINSSGNTSTGAIGGAGTAYLYSTANDLAIGNGTAGKSVTFFTGGLTPSTYTERFRLDASGRVGIGTKTPTSDLAINQSSGSGSTKGITLSGNSIGGASTGTGFLVSLGYNSANNKQLWLGDPDYANNSTGTFARFSTSSGYTILDAIDGNNGNRKPIALGVASDANSTIILGADLNTTTPSSYVWANGNMAIGNGYRGNAAPTNGLIVQGKVGIGTSSPADLLDISGTGGTLFSRFNSTATGDRNLFAVSNTATNGGSIDMRSYGSAYSETLFGNSMSGSSALISNNLASAPLIIGTGTAGDLVLGANNVERLRITSGGNISSVANVYPSANNTYTLGTSSNRWSTIYAVNALNTSSDRRLKTNIIDLKYGLKEVIAMQPVSYNWKATPDTDKKLGLIAQDVRKIIPEVVKGDEAKETLSIAYSDLIPVLINAIKEQQKQIEALKQKVEKLEKK